MSHSSVVAPVDEHGACRGGYVLCDVKTPPLARYETTLQRWWRARDLDVYCIAIASVGEAPGSAEWGESDTGLTVL
jgi:hypothetical protein